MNFLYINPEGTKTRKTTFYDPSKRVSVEVDTILTGKHTLTTEVTEFPIDSGETISDHAINKPTVWNYDCLISDTPASPGSGTVQTFPTGYQVSSGDDTLSAAREAYNTLLKFRVGRIPLQVQDGLDVLYPMLITSLTIDLSKRTNNALYFSITLKEIVIVSSQGGLVPQIDAALADKLAAEANKGNVNGKETPVGPSIIMKTAIKLGVAAPK